ncbi:hypothetical protein [Streptomyces violaceusniger]|uniref:Uncharacterized protein n=1 Tax=Streptomyces violaceusniger (strain Tu 4113) TaxID=653045 RepID=G2PHD2_STRV4|nr:hypothetical protein [Streptomyces violaceusniger]AEM88778.1 hypothetical protein Strvi_0001 [Streptomyces violaceusniger Tu 4113]
MSSATWGLGVLKASDGDRWASVVVQPDEEAVHAELAVRLKAAGLKRVNDREWHAGLWPVSRCSVTVVGGCVTQMHTGRSRILAGQPPSVTPGWEAAAGRGRVLLALVQPGVFDPADSTGEPLGEEAWAGMDVAVQAGAVLAALAEVRAGAEPYGRRW